MASEKARMAKDKGNAAFKAADYPTAIGHYTDAILADSRDHTFFLNRAAAYLKLGKSEDAERDCTKVLALNPNNVKAFFRRGQARRALGNTEEARADLDKALALEPANESVKNEILELDKVSERQKVKQRSKYIPGDAPKSTAPKRRRVPIEIVDGDTRVTDEARVPIPPETKDTDLLQPVSSRSLKQAGNPTATQSSPSKPQTFMDAKQVREESKPARVSGGIFRHTGNHTIVTRPSSENVSSTRESISRPIPSSTSTPRSTKQPTTLFQFTKSWESIQSDADRWNLLRTISPSSIPALFQVSLEPELLKSVLHTFRAILEQDSTLCTRDNVRDYLLAFTKVQRFGMVMLFMDKQDRQLLELLHEKDDGISYCQALVMTLAMLSNERPANLNAAVANDTHDQLPLKSLARTTSHVSLLVTFKENLARAGLYRPATNESRASHDDATLMRFLRARLFDPTKAGKQFANAEAWRKQHDVDKLFESFDVDELESSRRFYPRWTGRRDKHGRPLYVFRLASLDTSLRRELDAVRPERRYQRIIMLHEFMTRLVVPLCDHLPRREPSSPSPISTVTTIVDLAHVSLRDMWSLRSHLQQASTMATANYPETVDTIAVVNAPSFFPVVWNWIKVWFDEGTRRKMHILGRNPGDVLCDFIDKEDLPETYGGKLKWVFEDEPYLDDDIQKVVGEMPKGPLVFMDGRIASP